jgi:HEAT repeat protein
VQPRPAVRAIPIEPDPPLRAEPVVFPTLNFDEAPTGPKSSAASPEGVKSGAECDRNAPVRRPGEDVRKALEMLAELKTPGADSILVDQLQNDDRFDYAMDVLRRRGESVEELVLPLLNHTEEKVRCRSCRLLQDTGTGKSVEALERLRETGGPSLRLQAEDALRSIGRRAKASE